MGNVILGGALAIIGGVVAHLIGRVLQSRRDDRGRHYEQRRTMHVDFAREFERVYEAVAEAEYRGGGRPSDYDYRVSGKLPELLMAIRIFALPATYEAAKAVMDRYEEWISTDGEADDSPMRAAFDAYLDQVRKELGIDRNPARLNWRFRR
ncbi:hypothetical protein [Planobispora rosea]|uniref:hypothetical protein n=1 Tax=Planobispora rosea TaxID=35762 RepID=UPI00083A5385|nr:hypothetical protein [Planobispora rosea]